MTDETLIMWTIGQVAERDGVSKPAVSKAIKKLIEARPDTPVNYDGQGRVLAISLAHYDEFRQRFVNPNKATAPIRRLDEKPGKQASPEDSLEEAKRQSEWLRLGREKIRHQEELKQLVRRDRLNDAVRSAGAEIRTVVSRLANRADDIALAVSKEGVHGARVALRTIAFELGNEIADKLAAIAVTAPEVDELIEDDAE
jgi:hypothetical protein